MQIPLIPSKQQFVRLLPSNVLPLTCITQVRAVLGLSERGEKFQYQQTLLSGFVLKPQHKALGDPEKASTLSLEELLEVEVCTEQFMVRPMISGYQKRPFIPSSIQNITPITPETLAKWKRTGMDRKQVEEEAIKQAKELLKPPTQQARTWE